MQSPKMPQMYISKYNRFVDNIIGRINRMLGKSYDPVRVKLLSGSQSKKSKDAAKKRKNTKRRKGGAPMTNKMAEVAIARADGPAYVLVSKAGDATPKMRKPNAKRTKNKQKKNNKKKSNNKKQASGGKGKASRAKATLFGLSSIRRDGDVSVNMMSDHTTVKTNFVIGPLMLRVERQTARGAKREVKSATATTEEMHGRLNLRIVHGGAATLHSIRVLQPKQVRVESSDNHDKTKEFMWRRSPHIATLVSQKLASAARSMLKPAPSS